MRGVSRTFEEEGGVATYGEHGAHLRKDLDKGLHYISEQQRERQPRCAEDQTCRMTPGVDIRGRPFRFEGYTHHARNVLAQRLERGLAS